MLDQADGKSTGKRRNDSIGFATLKLGPLCPEAGYDYHIFDVAAEKVGDGPDEGGEALVGGEADKRLFIGQRGSAA